MKSRLLFLADCGNETFKMLSDFSEYYKLTAVSLTIEEFWKSIGQHLSKFRARVQWHVFDSQIHIGLLMTR